ncbi:MAG: ATP-binding cassette domain-containing protein [Pseudomonadota bacterium]
MTDALLSIKNLNYAWSSDPDPVIADLSLAVNRGEKVFLAGASGSGKSTLLALIGGLIVADQGEIRIAGESLSDLSRASRDRFRADHLGVIFQQFNLLPWLDVLGNVGLGCHFSSRRRKRTGAVQPAAEGCCCPTLS